MSVIQFNLNDYDVGFFVNGLHEDYAEAPEDAEALNRAISG